MKRTLAVLMLMGVLILLIVACSQNMGIAGNPSTVHMNDDQFEQSTVTIQKGESLTLVDDSAATHIIANGSWQSNGIPRYAVEAGAPKVTVQFSGNDSHTIGPFTTAGTFHFYCTIHQGMNLTVIVH